MKKLGLLLLILAVSVVSASSRDWKDARVINSSETQVSSGMRGDTNTLHYTVETDTMIYDLDYSYRPSQRGSSGAPDIAVNVKIKIAVEGKSAYILDVNGREVKLHVVKKKAK